MTVRVTDVDGGAQFAVKAVPGSSKDRIVGAHGDALKVTVAAPPERGKANERILALLAEALAVPTATVTLVAGATNPRKTVRVRGVSAAEVQRRLGLAPDR